jgi:hypothetical protein
MAVKFLNHIREVLASNLEGISTTLTEFFMVFFNPSGQMKLQLLPK